MLMVLFTFKGATVHEIMEQSFKSYMEMTRAVATTLSFDFFWKVCKAGLQIPAAMDWPVKTLLYNGPP